MTLFLDSGATFSEDRKYRHLLWRVWDTTLPLLNCLMLNPSNAGAEINDPTVTRQMERAKILGCGGLLVTNAYDLVATDPKVILRHPEPKSAECNKQIIIASDRTVASNGFILCAWGKHCGKDRQAEILRLLAGWPLWCLDFNKDGSPVHPLYQKYDAPLIRFPRCSLCELPSCNGGCLH